MPESPKHNPIDQTDAYLEWLAGRGDKEPQLDPVDQDILKATRLLGMLREHDPRPALLPKIKHAVLATSQYVPTEVPEKSNRFRALLLWKIATPAMALGIVVVTVLLSQTPAPSNHAGTNFNKPIIADEKPAIVELVAAKEDALGVEATTSFTLTAKEGKLTLEEVQQNFSLNPSVELAITKKSDTVYEITPKMPLATGKVYAATYQASPTKVDGEVKPRTYSWAYQVRSEFGVIGLLPRDQATNVPLATGIEVTFSSAGVSADDFKKNFTIQPQAAGRIEVHQRTLVYIPEKPLAEKTVYTVTVKKGLKPANASNGLPEDVRFQFETAPKDQKESETIYSSFYPRQLFESVRPNEPMIFGSSNDPYSTGATPKATQFTVYQYKDLPAFLTAIGAQQNTRTAWAQFGSRGERYSTEGLNKIGVYKTTTNDGILTLGPGFAKGFYIADGGSGSDRAQIPFVVSDIGSYSITTKTDSLLWAHDLVTKKPLVGASVKLPGVTTPVSIGADGVARFPTPVGSVENPSYTTIATISTGSVEVPVLLNGAQYYYGPSRYIQSTDFWTYTTTDRPLYQPTDTVQFWGLLRRRDQPRASETITAQLVQRSYEGRYKEDIIATTTLTTSSFGTYIGSLKLNGVSTNASTELVILIGETRVATRYLTIEQYRKPPFQILIQPQQLAVIAGDKITYDITTQFFDGTPVPNLALRAAYTGGKTLVTTNAQGKATYSVTAAMNTGQFSLEPSDSQIQGVITDSYVQVFPAALEVTAETTLNGVTGTLIGTVYQVKPDQVTATSSDVFADTRGPVQPNQEVTGKLIEMIYEKTQSGTHYDYLLKQSVPTYQYSTKEEVRESFAVTTSANGTYEKTFTLSADGTYRVELSTNDTKNRTATTTTYFWRSSSGNYFGGSLYYLQDVTEINGATAKNYGIGETVNLQVFLNGENATVPTDGSVLYLFNQRGLRRYDVRPETTMSFSFSESDVPSISSRAVIFTGVGYAEAYGPTTVFDVSTRKLTIDVTADKPTYNPGDRVELKVKTSDVNGRGVAAKVNIKAIDEAFLTLTYGDEPNPASIYNQVEDGVIGSYISHQAIENRAFAEGGGGGGERTNFRDTAVFTEVTTDAQGNGSLTFTLPDNLTSWRLTAQGFSDGLFVGQTQSALIVSKDVFVNVAFENDQLSRDRGTVLAGTYGRALTDKDGVAYTFSIVDVPNSETKQSAPAFSIVRYALPELATGTYRVRTAVEAKGKTDVVELPLTVTGSRLLRRTVKSMMLPSETPLPYGNTGKTIFRFDDADRNVAYETLWDIVGEAYSRLDDTAAANIARRLLQDQYGESYGGDVGDLVPFLTGKGAALYVIGSENLEYGSLAAEELALNGSRQELLGWFRGALDDPKQNTEQVAYALYGLAQLGEPVLPEIRQVLAAQDLADRDRLTLLLALEALGAKEDARPAALALFQKYGESQDLFFRLNLGENDDEKIVASARFTILAAGLGLDQRYGLLRYLGAYPPKETRTTLERALATSRLRATTPPNEATITYELEGKSATVTLTAEKPLILTLDATQAKTLKVTAVTGRVGLISTFQEAFDITKATRDPRLSITRTYLVNGKKTTTFATGDLVRVQFTWSKKGDAFGKNFSIIDLLPTGLRPISNPWNYDRTRQLAYPYAIAGQRVSIYAGDKGSTFYYLARASAPGRTVGEPAVLQAYDAPSSIQYSNEAVVEIK